MFFIFATAALARIARYIWIEIVCKDPNNGLPSLLALAYISTGSIPFVFSAALALEGKEFYYSKFINNSTNGISMFGYLSLASAIACSYFFR